MTLHSPLRARRGTRLAATAAGLALVLGAAACGSDDSSGEGSDDSASGGSSETTLTVLAAASLTETFTELGKEFESQHPGTTVKFSFDSSATLAEQAKEGAPADILATADQETMDSATDALEGDATKFATNEIVMVTPADNPAGLEDFADIADSTFVICVETAPCGKLGAALLADNDITAKPASLEVDVKSVLAKVVDDEADAGLVYRSDAVAEGDSIKEFPVPGSDEEVTSYYVAPLQQSKDADLAQDWVTLVSGADGQKVLSDAGFGSP